MMCPYVIPDFGVRPKLHHVITAEPVLASLLSVVCADGLPIQEGAIQAASVGELPAALFGLPGYDNMPARDLRVREG